MPSRCKVFACALAQLHRIAVVTQKSDADDQHATGVLPCGLYRTTVPLPGHEKSVPAKRLIYFHNHSKDGGSMLQLPAENKFNRWTFHKNGYSIREPLFESSLERLKPEGIWRVREHFHPDDEQIVAKNAVVQLGYNRAGQPIIFFPKAVEETNGFVFPSRGTSVPRAIYDLLEPLNVRGPEIPKKLH